MDPWHIEFRVERVSLGEVHVEQVVDFVGICGRAPRVDVGNRYLVVGSGARADEADLLSWSFEPIAAPALPAELSWHDPLPGSNRPLMPVGVFVGGLAAVAAAVGVVVLVRGPRCREDGSGGMAEPQVT